MKTYKLTAIALTSILLFSFNIKSLNEVIDYLSFGKVVSFNNEKYTLSWSSNPTNSYNKQEYLVNPLKNESKRSMIIVEAVEGEIEASDALNFKIQELEKRKEWDYVANYKVYTNEDKKNEAIIDFVVSDTGTIYEWNLYRYQTQIDKKKTKKLVLFAYSYRDSLNDNEDLKAFFNHITKYKVNLINQLQAYKIPQIK